MAHRTSWHPCEVTALVKLVASPTPLSEKEILARMEPSTTGLYLTGKNLTAMRSALQGLDAPPPLRAVHREKVHHRGKRLAFEIAALTLFIHSEHHSSLKDIAVTRLEQIYQNGKI